MYLSKKLFLLSAILALGLSQSACTSRLRYALFGDSNPPLVLANSLNNPSFSAVDCSVSTLFATASTGGTSYSDAVGTSDKPFHLQTPQHVNGIRCYPSAYYLLDNDIDFSLAALPIAPIPIDADYNDVSNVVNGGAGDFTKEFTGTIDGQGFAFKNWSYSGSTYIYASLFAIANQATFKNLGVVNPTITTTATQTSALPPIAAGLVGGDINGIYENITMTTNTPISLALPGGNGTAAFLLAGSYGGAHFNTVSLSTSNGAAITALAGTDSNKLGGLVGGIGGYSPSTFNQITVSLNHTTMSAGAASTNAFVGGVFASNKNVTVSNLNFSIDATSSLNGGGAGAIIGGVIAKEKGGSHYTSLTAVNSGATYTAAGNSSIGGIFGSSTQSTMSTISLTNTGSTLSASSSGDHMGGVTGQDSGSIYTGVTVVDTGSNYTISGLNNIMGGIFGSTSESTLSTLSLTIDATSTFSGSNVGTIGGITGQDSGSIYTGLTISDAGATYSSNDGHLGGVFGNVGNTTASNVSLTSKAQMIGANGANVGGYYGYANGAAGTFNNSTVEFQSGALLQGGDDSNVGGFTSFGNATMVNGITVTIDSGAQLVGGNKGTQWPAVAAFVAADTGNPNGVVSNYQNVTVIINGTLTGGNAQQVAGVLADVCNSPSITNLTLHLGATAIFNIGSGFLGTFLSGDPTTCNGGTLNYTFSSNVTGIVNSGATFNITTPGSTSSNTVSSPSYGAFGGIMN